MVSQRVELGLLPDSSRVIFPARIEVIPVVAVGPGAKQTAWDRLHEVAQRVETIRRGAKIELWEVNTIGRVQSATGTLYSPCS